MKSQFSFKDIVNTFLKQGNQKLLLKNSNSALKNMDSSTSTSSTYDYFFVLLMLIFFDVCEIMFTFKALNNVQVTQ